MHKVTKSSLTNGNEAILNEQIDLKIPGGTYNTSPLLCITAFTLIVLSNFSSALEINVSFYSIVTIASIMLVPIVEKNIRCPNLSTR